MVIAVERYAPYPTRASSVACVADCVNETSLLARAYTAVFRSLVADCTPEGIRVAGVIYLSVEKVILDLFPLGRPAETPRVSTVGSRRILLRQTCFTVCYECDEPGDDRTGFNPRPARSTHIFGRWRGPR